MARLLVGITRMHLMCLLTRVSFPDNVTANRLDEEMQELLRLRFAGGVAYREIGEIVGRSEGAVEMAVHRLLHPLEEALGTLLSAPEPDPAFVYLLERQLIGHEKTVR